MKRVLTVFAILVLISSVSMAQLGVKGGLSLSTLGGDDAKFMGVEPITRTGFTAGAYYNIGLVLGLSIQPEVSYTQKGAVYKDATGELTMKHDYLDIPVVVKWAPLPLPVLKPYLEGGVSYSILMGAKWKDNAGNETPELKDQFAKNDFSIVLGAGVNLSLGVIDLAVDARYVMGMTKIPKEVSGVETPKTYNRAFILTAGLNF